MILFAEIEMKRLQCVLRRRCVVMRHMVGDEGGGGERVPLGTFGEGMSPSSPTPGPKYVISQ